VLSLRAQRNKGFTVEPLSPPVRRSHEGLYGDPHGQDSLDSYEERLRDNTQSPVPEQAAFRIDFPEWLESLESRDRSIAKDSASSAEPSTTPGCASTANGIDPFARAEARPRGTSPA
jgi:hypothetical protein